MTLMSPNRLVMIFDDWVALHLVEQHRAGAIEMLLQTGDFEVWIDRLVGLDQIALRLEPFQRVAQAAGMLHNL